MKKFAIILSTLFLFTSCFGGGDEDTGEITNTGTANTYQTSNFSLTIPQDWELIERNMFPSNVPRETVLVIRNNIKSTVFTATANVTETPIASDISTVDFARSTLNQNKTRLQNFQEISRTEGEITTIHFQGKLSPTEPIVEHTQVFHSKDGLAYTLTISHLPTEDEGVVNTLAQVLESFRLN